MNAAASMKLYGSLASPYVARVAMCAWLKGIDLPMEPAPGGMGSDEFKKTNLTGKIPALMTADGYCITESEVIAEYLEVLFPEPALLPADPLGQAQSRMITRLTDAYIAPHNTPLMRMRDPAGRDQAVVDRQAAEFATGFAIIEHYMGPGPFAVADKPMLADCALAPFIGMLQQTIFPFFDEIPDPTLQGGRLEIWWQALQDHERCQQSIDAYSNALEEFLTRLWARMSQVRG
ncbi:MAG: glutathione S-transferase family protein [Gammaproteobacteria bacterium]|nr:glutathione S-transferase family protein [Gammaproteobacteria bacterium]